MTVYKYLGYGETDESGVAHLEYDADGEPLDPVGYTGVGAGEMDFIASLDNPIESGSIVSVPYEVLDCGYYDEAVDGKKNENYNLSSGTSSQVSVSEDGTLIEFDSQYRFYSPTTTGTSYLNRLELNGDFCVEITVVETTGFGLNIQQLDGNNARRKRLSEGVWKLTAQNNKLKWELDGVQQGSLMDLPTQSYWVWIQSVDATASILFKDLKIYPI